MKQQLKRKLSPTELNAERNCVYMYDRNCVKGDGDGDVEQEVCSYIMYDKKEVRNR